MASFRETLWFKKGELDAAAAHDPDGLGAADLLPIEDRYRDDGSVSTADSTAFGVRSGQTRALARLPEVAEPATGGSIAVELMRELKRGRFALLAALVMSIALVVAAVYAA